MAWQQDFALTTASAFKAKLMAGAIVMAKPMMKTVNLRDIKK